MVDVENTNTCLDCLGTGIIVGEGGLAGQPCRECAPADIAIYGGAAGGGKSAPRPDPECKKAVTRKATDR